jgi:hypothetical protein
MSLLSLVVLGMLDLSSCSHREFVWQTVMTRRARATRWWCRHPASPDPTEWDSMVADTFMSLGLSWLACGWVKERVGWVPRVEASDKRRVIGYSVWGS